MEKIGIFYGSTTGNTESAAQQIQKIIGSEYADLVDIASTTADTIENYRNLILGASTWGIGDLQDDFESFLPKLTKAELSNKKIALFGLGDQDTYADSFVDGIGIIYECLEGKDCTIIGSVSAEGYDFESSRALQNGVFVGLPLDEENQSELTTQRLNDWIQRLREQFL